MGRNRSEPLHPDDETILGYLVRGEARTLYEAEECFLNAALPGFVALLAGPASDTELSQHPLVALLLAHGSRGWEDSLL